MSGRSIQVGLRGRIRALNIDMASGNAGGAGNRIGGRCGMVSSAGGVRWDDQRPSFKVEIVYELFLNSGSGGDAMTDMAQWTIPQTRFSVSQ